MAQVADAEMRTRMAQSSPDGVDDPGQGLLSRAGILQNINNVNTTALANRGIANAGRVSSLDAPALARAGFMVQPIPASAPVESPEDKLEQLKSEQAARGVYTPNKRLPTGTKLSTGSRARIRMTGEIKDRYDEDGQLLDTPTARRRSRERQLNKQTARRLQRYLVRRGIDPTGMDLDQLRAAKTQHRAGAAARLQANDGMTPVASPPQPAAPSLANHAPVDPYSEREDQMKQARKMVADLVDQGATPEQARAAFKEHGVQAALIEDLDRELAPTLAEKFFDNPNPSWWQMDPISLLLNRHARDGVRAAFGLEGPSEATLNAQRRERSRLLTRQYSQ
jgi:hypothetical protein